MNDIQGVLSEFTKRGVDTSELEEIVGDAKHWKDLPRDVAKKASHKLALLIFRLSNLPAGKS